VSAAPVLVFGAGGHGKVVAEIVRAAGLTVDGFVDDGIEAGTQVLGAPVVGNRAWLVRQPPRLVALGLGNNRRREEVALELEASGHTLGCFVHPTAWLSPTAQLGAGTVVMARVVVNAEARVGRGVILNTACVVEHECDVAAFAHISPSATLGGGAVVGRRTHVGIGATVLHLARIGDDCVIGGGAVVLKTVASGLTVVGVPARPLTRHP
jgi:sugar O-acyltransferase (sialic acid O-acetyltransferase NeuD family)